MAMRETNLTQTLASVFVLGLIMSLGLGCNKESTDNPETEKQTSARSDLRYDDQKNFRNDDRASRGKVVGVWLGTASIDEVKLQGKLEMLAAEQKQAALAKAQSFLSTTMAIEYRDDGSVEHDLELVSVDGHLLRDGSVGTWSVVESSDNGVVIETVESLSDGTTSANKVMYKFVEDASQFIVAVPVSIDLQECDATLVFKRQNLPPLNVADNVGQTQTK